MQEAIETNRLARQTEDIRQETEQLEQSLEDLQQKRKELIDSRYEMLGVTSDYSDVANSWAEAWLSGYSEVGSGLEALKDSYNSFIDSIIARQVQFQVFGPAMGRLEGLVSDILKDSIISEEDMAMLHRFRETELDLLNQRAEQLMQSLGIEPSGASNDSSISRGIESITETQASALEALMSSTNFLAASCDQHLASISAALGGYDGANTILSYIRMQSLQLEALTRIANSVYYPGHHSRGPGAIKVVVD